MAIPQLMPTPENNGTQQASRRRLITWAGRATSYSNTLLRNSRATAHVIGSCPSFQSRQNTTFQTSQGIANALTFRGFAQGVKRFGNRLQR